MEWLQSSFEEFTVVWLLISSLVGGAIAALGFTSKFFLKEVVRPRIETKREIARVVRRYKNPIIRSANSLERRINIIIRSAEKRWYHSDEYFQLSTLYQFGEFLGWVRILERRYGFLPFESDRRGRKFYRRLSAVFRALSSHSYFHRSWFQDQEAVAASLVPRLILSAIGEVMIRADVTGEKEIEILEFTAFAEKYKTDDTFRGWFRGLDLYLYSCSVDHPLHWDRLIAAAASLRALIIYLDPNGVMVDRIAVQNLDRVVHEKVAQAIREEMDRI